MSYGRAEDRRVPGDAGAGVVPFRRDASPVVYEPIDGQPGDEGDFGNLRDILTTLLRRKWLILSVIILGMTAAVTYLLSATPLYQARALIEIERQEAQIIKEGDVQPAAVADNTHVDTQVALLKSRALAQRVAEMLGLPSDPEFVSDQTLSVTERQIAATDALLKATSVRKVGLSRVIELQYKGKDPAQAAQIVNALGETFIQMALERRYNATSYARSFLDERLRTTKASLEEAERNLVAYSREQQILDLSSVGGSELGGSLDAASLTGLNAALTKAQEDRIAAEERFKEARDSGSSLAVMQSRTVEEMRRQRFELSSQYQEMLAKFKPDYPDMKELAGRIESIDRDIAGERDSIIAALESEFRAAQAREAALTEQVDLLKNNVQDLRGRSIDYTILARDVDTLRSQYDALLQRFKEVSIASGIGSSQVSIVDPAEAPRFPSDPNARNVILLGALLSLMAGCGLAFMIEFLDDTIKTPDDVKNKLGLPVIGVMPKLKEKDRFAEQLRDPRSSISEAFSSARTALQFSTAHGAPRSLMVTGSRPSEGKTSTVTALGLAFASSGKRVLIIDADMRRPSFSVKAGSSIGLSGVLTQGGSLMPHVIAGQADQLFLLPSGVIPPNPAELLGSPRLREILDEAMDNFDLVLVDSPPVLDFADAPTLSAVCEASLLVVQAGAIRRPVVQRTIERLLGANGQVIGALLTKFDVKRSGYGYGYYYTYNYDYGSKAVSADVKRRRRIDLFVDTNPLDDRSAAG
jgi:capsular exopolysaccharide synthesis family protein